MPDFISSIVYVNDMEQSLPFYRDVLGMVVEATSKGWAIVSSNASKLALRSEPNSSSPRHGTTVHISLPVENLTNLTKRLSEHGVNFETMPEQTPFGVSATICDPEGNHIDLIEQQTSGRENRVSGDTIVNDILAKAPEAMEVLEEHGIRICGGCIVLLNSTVRQTAEYSGLSPAESFKMVQELNHKLSE